MVCRKRRFVRVTLCRFLQPEHPSGQGSILLWMDISVVVVWSGTSFYVCLLCLDMPCRGTGLSSRLWVIEQVHAGISLITNKVEHLFMFLSAIEIFSFESVCVRHFPTLCRSIDLQQSLIYPGYNTLSLLCVANTSSLPRPSMSFHSLGGII